MTKDSITIFAPASVSNVGPGFDILGFALEGMGDTITLSRRDGAAYIIDPVGVELPEDPEKNVATVALRSFCNAVGYDGGFLIRIEKNFTPGSGLGSSASSAVGAVFAANELLEAGYSREELITYALDGEMLASGNRHADNVAPCMLGGFVAVRSCDPFKGFQIAYPKALKVLIIFPDVPIQTADARGILPREVSMNQAIKQSANMAGLINGLVTANYRMIRESLHDELAQPYRKKLIPNYDAVEKLCHQHEAVGFNISGSGPAMFAFFQVDNDLTVLKEEIKGLYQTKGIACRFHESGINGRGVEVLN
ncbi:homoserine kinase [Roseivirga sp.]|uniref:homoserine kinase n=1 Tax=Roseivirga sp. TaxID=1964215 RepID=UPI003B5232C5